MIADDADLLVVLVVRAIPLRDLLAHVVHVGEAVGVEMRPVGHHHDDVGAALGLDGRGDSRIQIVHVDQVDRDVDPGQLPEFRRESLELDVGGRNEAHPLEDVELRPLRKARGLLRRDDVGDPARDGDARRHAGHLEEDPSIEVRHAEIRGAA